MTSATVLLCSTSESVLRAWTLALDESVRVVMARDYEQAIERVVLDPAVHLLLLDSNWSPFDGARLISRLRGDSMIRLSGLPIFLIEQSGQSTTIELWLREGADGLLSGRRETQGIAGLFRRFSTIGSTASRLSVTNAVGSPSGDAQAEPSQDLASQSSAWQREASRLEASRLDASSPETSSPEPSNPETSTAFALNTVPVPTSPARPILDIELKWQPAEGPTAQTGADAAPVVEDWARELGVRLRANDRWQARSHCSGELQLQCDRPDVLAPLNRLAWALHKRPELVAGKLTARFEDTTYQLPL